MAGLWVPQGLVSGQEGACPVNAPHRGGQGCQFKVAKSCSLGGLLPTSATKGRCWLEGPPAAPAREPSSVVHRKERFLCSLFKALCSYCIEHFSSFG